MSSERTENPAGLMAVAESSSRELLFRPSFWLSQGRFWLIVSAGVLSFYLLAPYTYDYAHGFIYLTIFIQLLAGWGALLAFHSTARLEVEAAILHVIEQKASALLRALKARQIPAVELSRLEADVLPDNTSEPTPAMIRLFRHICKEAADRRFESSINVIQPYREEPLDDIFKLQNLQKIALWLGILGTFVGLMLAIRDADVTDLKRMEEFSGVVTKMFGSLFVAFTASLAGLEVAVILGFLLLHLRKKQEVYFKLMESSVVTMLSLARHALNRDDLVAEFSQVSTAMRQLNETVALQTTVLSNSLGELQRQLIQQNEQIRGGLEKLMTTGKEFDGFLNGLTESQRQFVTDVQGVYDVVSLKQLGSTLQNKIAEAGNHISQSIKPNVSLVAEQMTQLSGALGTLSQTLLHQSVEVSENVRRLDTQIKAQAADNARTVREVGMQLRESVGRAEVNTTHALTRDVQELSKNVSALNRKLARYDGGNGFGEGFRRKLKDIIYSFRLWSGL
jgi:hypothetical protein